MRSCNFEGYDPYDFTSSAYLGHSLKKCKTLMVLGTQAFKFSPFNARHLIGIRKKHNLKTIVLTARSLLKYFGVIGAQEGLKSDFDLLLRIVHASAIRHGDGVCWSRIDYDYYSTTGTQSRNSGIIYLTTLCGLLYLEAYEHYRDVGYLSAAERIGTFLNSVDVFEEDNRLCYYYTTSLKNRIYNASAHACAFLCRLTYLSGKDIYLDRARRGINYIVSGQNPDGSWDYGIDSNGKRLKLRDYHQGFILDSLYLCSGTPGITVPAEAMARGVRFYLKEGFFSDGRSVFRYPRVWPIDVHNQAQGIITFHLLGGMFPECGEFALKVADWTIKHMYDPVKHIFFYQKWPFFTNRISYMRWNQAWMLFALSHLLSPASTRAQN
jgi:hypothetical protein